MQSLRVRPAGWRRPHFFQMKCNPCLSHGRQFGEVGFVEGGGCHLEVVGLELMVVVEASAKEVAAEVQGTVVVVYQRAAVQKMVELSF
jgi:hypothetical protein